MFNFLTRRTNKLYLRFRCHYLYTDEYGNKVFQAPYFNSDDIKTISVEPEEEHYLIRYLEWFADDCFYEEYLASSDSLSLFHNM